MTAAATIFVLTYAAIGTGRLPGRRLDRPVAALLGAVAMVVCGVLPASRAYAAIDVPTLTLLLGLMVLTSRLAEDGLFTAVAGAIARSGRGPHALLASVVVASGLLSALFLNDAVCLLFTPLVLRVARRSGLPPLPYLLAVATASNVGGACTLSGNPQNALIGVQSGIGYGEFLRRLAPASLLGLALTYAVIAFVYRRALGAAAAASRTGAAAGAPGGVPSGRAIGGAADGGGLDAGAPPVSARSLSRSLVVAAGMLVAFLLHVDVGLAAIAAGGAVLLLASDGPRAGGRPGATPPEGAGRPEPFRGVDFPLLVTFAGLFVVTEGVRASGLADLLLAVAETHGASDPAARIAGITGVSLVLSNLVSNVPAVMLLGPVVAAGPHPTLGWLALAMGSTFAGNLTLVGSIANLIVAELARRECPISFVEYLKVGVPITAGTTAIGLLVLIAQS